LGCFVNAVKLGFSGTCESRAIEIHFRIKILSFRPFGIWLGLTIGILFVLGIQMVTLYSCKKREKV
jgi:hypothetical protein